MGTFRKFYDKAHIFRAKYGSIDFALGRWTTTVGQNAWQFYHSIFLRYEIEKGLRAVAASRLSKNTDTPNFSPNTDLWHFPMLDRRAWD